MMPNNRFISTKISIASALFVTTVVSICLLVLLLTDTYNTGKLLSWTINDRATVQIIVQVLSTFLATLQIYICGALIALRTNLHIRSHPIAVDVLAACHALRSGQINFNLPKLLFAGSLLYITITQIPGAIWAGSISPVVGHANITAWYSIPALASSSPESLYWSETCPPGVSCFDGQRDTNSVQDLGKFTSTPWKYLCGSFLDSINYAASRNGSVTKRKKLDNTGYSYHGRSYGVGAGVGLADGPYLYRSGSNVSLEYGDIPKINAFTFAERGFISNVSCIRNLTAALNTTELMGGEGDVGYVIILYQGGSLPSGSWEGYYSTSLYSASTNVGLAAVKSNTHYYYGLIGGDFYSTLTGVQCEVSFHPATFQVYVNPVTQNISVTPASYDSWQDSIDPTGALVNNSFTSLDYLVRILSTLYTGAVGNAFIDNMLAVYQAETNTTTNVGEMLVGQYDKISNSSILQGAQYSLEILLDEYISALTAAQLMLYSQSSQVQTTVLIQVVRLGSAPYIWASFFINLLILLCFLTELFFTRFWRDVPALNCLDIKSAIIAVSLSGENPTQEASMWNGDSSDRRTGELKLGIGKGRVALRLMSNEKESVISSTDLTSYSSSNGGYVLDAIAMPGRAINASEHLLREY